MKKIVDDLVAQSLVDTDEKLEGASLIALEDQMDKAEQIKLILKNVEWLMGNDRKVGPLKELQGMIWEMGYKNESIKGQ